MSTMSTCIHFGIDIGLACATRQSRLTGRSPRRLWSILDKSSQDTFPQKISAQTDERFPSHGLSKFGSK
jgi:hypothetical protein